VAAQRTDPCFLGIEAFKTYVCGMADGALRARRQGSVIDGSEK